MGYEILLFAVFLLGLSLYVFLGGADFGFGIWAVLLKARDKTGRDRLFSVMGPVWEANHVWLILCLVLLLGGFPRGLAALCQALWLPLLLALAGIIARGAAFALRQSFAGQPRAEAAWEWIFGLGSASALFSFGACAVLLVSEKLPFSPQGEYLGGFAYDFTAFPAAAGGLLALCLAAWLAALFMARDSARQGFERGASLWRNRALVSAGFVATAFLAGLAWLKWDCPAFWSQLVDRCLLVLAGAAFLFACALAFSRRKHDTWAVFSAGAAVMVAVFGMGLASFPFLIFGRLTLDDAAAPEGTLKFMTWALCIGLVFLVPCLVLFFKVFRFDKKT